MRTVARLGWLAAVVVLLAACQHPPAARWVVEPQAKRIVATTARDPQMYATAAGDISLALAETREGSGHDVVMRTSHDGGDSFSDPLAISRKPGEAYIHGEAPPVLLEGAHGDVNVLWVAQQGPATPIRLARSHDYGHTFSEPVDVDTGNGAGPFFAATVAPDGTLIVTWLSYDPTPGNRSDNASLKVTSSSDGGRSWQDPVRVAVNVCGCCRPEIVAADASRWFVTWRNVSQRNVRDIVVASSTDRGRTWSEAVAAASDGWKIDGCPHAGPSLAVANGELWVAWSSAADGRYASFATHSPLDQLRFAPRRTISTGIDDARHPHLAVSQGRPLAVFQGRDASEAKGFASSRVYLCDLGDASGKPLALPRSSGSAMYPRLIGLDGGRVLVAWTDNSQAGTSAWGARVRMR
jgi:hypothetical protein